MTITINVHPKIFVPIYQGTRTFLVTVDSHAYQSGQTLFFREIHGNSQTGRSIECEIVSILRAFECTSLKPGSCVIGFAARKKDQAEVITRTQLANILELTIDSVGQDREKSQYYRRERATRQPRFNQ